VELRGKLDLQDVGLDEAEFACEQRGNRRDVGGMLVKRRVAFGLLVPEPGDPAFARRRRRFLHTGHSVPLVASARCSLN
jgi:hypothetical protein